MNVEHFNFIFGINMIFKKRNSVLEKDGEVPE